MYDITDGPPFSMFMLCRILKTFNNSWMMQLHTILKFGSFVVLLDPLKMFQNQMFDIIFMANQNFHNTFPVGSHISTMSITATSQICDGAKPYMSVVDIFVVINNHLVG